MIPLLVRSYTARLLQVELLDYLIELKYNGLLL